MTAVSCTEVVNGGSIFSLQQCLSNVSLVKDTLELHSGTKPLPSSSIIRHRTVQLPNGGSNHPLTLPPIILPTPLLSSLFSLCVLQAPRTSSLYPTLSTTLAVWSCIYRQARKTLVPTCYWSSRSRSFLSPVLTSFVPRNNSVSGL